MTRARQAHTVEPEQNEQDEPPFRWVPYRTVGSQLRVSHTSCCGLWEWASEGGQFFVLRRTGDCYEETGRGLYRQALDIYIALAEAHHAEHLRHGETPEPDTFLKGRGQRG
ncbi:hypothetical protein [Nonomuraea sp. NEAU-A123]|uniref:hypothetical protein n=1 Tax=Nonomuraea sp. NEAU-A123 TaxID=2839649 RepID=UPI001BE4D366|nr:hypothetical protein [Nonomuraea sp. NEAU-A123]MBT2232781.1 hypothetical protein [Nonomuraea sp. NEAU-A123]